MLNYIKKGDIFVAILLLLISFSLVIFINRPRENSGDLYASIQLDGKEIETVELSKENSGETIRIDSAYGYNILEVGDGRIRAIESDCDEKIHIKQGWISNPGQTLICLPHRLVVEVNAEDEQTKIDHINF